MKKSIYDKIRTHAFYVVIIALVFFVLISAAGIFFIRRIVIVSNESLIDAVVQSMDDVLSEYTDTDLTGAMNVYFDTLSKSELASIDRNIAMLAAAALILAVLVILGSVYAARHTASRISAPIQQLVEGAERIGEGDLEHVIEIDSGDELEILADALNAMVANLQNIKTKVRIADVKKKFVEDSHRNLRSILDTLPVGIRIISLDDWTLLYSNSTCLKVFGCNSFEEQVEGQSGLGFMPEYQPDGRKTSDLLAEFAEQDEGIGEVWCLKLNGEPFICRYTSCNIEYEGHRASLAAMEDVTAEYEYRKNLESAAEKAQEANQLKSRFLATMSHEIRTPMNAIIGMSELALRTEAVQEKDEHILLVRQAASNLLSIINDILDFSKIEAGKLTISPDEYSVASLINDIISIIKMRIMDSNLSFAIKADCNIPCMLIGDETRIRQVVLNLLNNSVKYTDEGHVLLGVYGEFINENMMNLIFEVTDTGIGISEEDIGKLFTDFTQLDIKDSRSVEGVGLGLAISHSIVRLMNGTISVRSEPGEGSIFTVTIPQRVYSKNSLARIRNQDSKSALIYTANDLYDETLIWSVKNLGEQGYVAKDKAEFLNIFDGGAYDYIFITHTLYKENEHAFKNLPEDTKAVIVVDFSEVAPGNAPRVLSMPVYCVQIAGIFNETIDYLSSARASNDDAIHFTAPGARVLIVDDIFTNLKVAEGLLSPYKMKIDLCNSGAEAIKKVQALAGTDDRYDLIFMDHKMPVMDGVEATVRIRAIDDSNPYYKNLPIIALTANAVEGMKEMFIDSGMNDFLAKPINTIRMTYILEKWIPKSKQITQI